MERWIMCYTLIGGGYDGFKGVLKIKISCFWEFLEGIIGLVVIFNGVYKRESKVEVLKVVVWWWLNC